MENQNRKKRQRVITKEEKIENLEQMKHHFKHMNIDMDAHYDKLIQHILNN